jgi:hypothetical protein
MVTQNTVRTRLVAKDEASGTISRLQSSVMGLGGGFGALKIAGAAAFAAIGAAAVVATGGIIGLTRAFNQAVDISMAAVKAANNLTVEIDNLSLKDAQVYISWLNKELANLAASLPGTTQGYINLANVIQNDVARGMKNPQGALNVEGWKQATSDITSMFMVMGEGLDEGLIIKGVQKLVSGAASLKELKVLALFEQNPAILKELEKAEKAIGKSWKEFTQTERIQTLQNLKEVFLSQDMIDALTNEMGGIIAGFKSKVFDPTTGLFGIMRELNSGGTVYETLSKSVKIVIGSDGIITKLARIFSSLTGITDPMESLQSSLEGLNNWLTWVDDLLNSLVAYDMENGVGLNWSQLIGHFMVGFRDWFNQTLNFDWQSAKSMNPGALLGKVIAELFNKLTSFLLTLDFASLGSTVGGFSAQVVNGILSGVLSLINNINWGDAVRLTAVIIGGLLSGLGSFFYNLDWKVYASSIVVLLGSAVVTALAASFLPALGTAFIVIGGSLLTVVGAALAGITAPIWLAIAAVGLAVVGMFVLVKKNWDSIKEAFTSAFSAIPDVIKTTGGFILKQIEHLAGPVVDIAKLTFGAISNVFSRIRRLLGLTNTNQESIEVPRAAGGFIPELFKRELQQAPSGSVPVIANSSELILNRQQQAMLLNSKPSGNTNNFRIEISGGNNPQEIATQVIQAIENKLSIARRSYVA